MLSYLRRTTEWNKGHMLELIRLPESGKYRKFACLATGMKSGSHASAWFQTKKSKILRFEILVTKCLCRNTAIVLLQFDGRLPFGCSSLSATFSISNDLRNSWKAFKPKHGHSLTRLYDRTEHTGIDSSGNGDSSARYISLLSVNTPLLTTAMLGDRHRSWFVQHVNWKANGFYPLQDLALLVLRGAL